MDSRKPPRRNNIQITVIRSFFILATSYDYLLNPHWQEYPIRIASLKAVAMGVLISIWSVEPSLARLRSFIWSICISNSLIRIAGNYLEMGWRIIPPARCKRIDHKSRLNEWKTLWDILRFFILLLVIWEGNSQTKRANCSGIVILFVLDIKAKLRWGW